MLTVLTFVVSLESLCSEQWGRDWAANFSTAGQ